MAKRDMRQTAATAKAAKVIPPQYDMTVPELHSLYRESLEGHESTYNAIETAFIYGFVLGQRAAKVQAKKDSAKG